MNTELLNEVADVIEYTGRFNLGVYAGKARGPGRYKTIAAVDLWDKCDTVGCVCGWVNALTDGENVADETRAAKLLGLTDGQAYELFTPPSWDGPDTVWGLKNPYAATAKQAARVLREIASGKRTFDCDRERDGALTS